MAEARAVAQDKRRVLLDAAVRVFARKGYHACRVGDIAAEAGVAHGLLYHYFSSKEEVLETIFRHTWTRMLDLFGDVEQSSEPAAEQIRRVAGIVLRSWQRDPDRIRVLVREVARSPHLQEEIEEIGHAYDALERIIRRGQESGEFRDGVPPRLAATIVYGALEQMLTAWVMGRAPDSDAEVGQAAEAVAAVLTVGLVAASANGR